MYVVYWRRIKYYTDLVIHNGMVSLKVAVSFIRYWPDILNVRRDCKAVRPLEISRKLRSAAVGIRCLHRKTHCVGFRRALLAVVVGNNGAVRRAPLYVARFGGTETPDTKTESRTETRAPSTSDITSCVATDPHTCRPIAFLPDSTDKTALQRCCVLPVRNSHCACQICFVSRESCVVAAVRHGLYTALMGRGW